MSTSPKHRPGHGEGKGWRFGRRCSIAGDSDSPGLMSMDPLRPADFALESLEHSGASALRLCHSTARCQCVEARPGYGPWAVVGSDSSPASVPAASHGGSQQVRVPGGLCQAPAAAAPPGRGQHHDGPGPPPRLACPRAGSGAVAGGGSPALGRRSHHSFPKSGS